MMVNTEDESSEPVLSETEFLDQSFDLLTGSYKDGRPSTSSGRLRAENSLGALDATAATSAPNAFESTRPFTQSSLRRPATAADGSMGATAGGSVFSRPAADASLALLPLPRLQAAHSASDLYGSSRGTSSRPCTPSSARFEESRLVGAAALGGLAVRARPESKQKKKVEESRPTVYSDVMGRFKPGALLTFIHIHKTRHLDSCHVCLCSRVC
jgi:hypothetical protein